ncbi:MAG: radical SAM methylthiotransferase, MiaB/RimO family protein [Berkelbacteria bacterium GW2011_GWA2_38_9]|uniref:Radical SAM methylthiotransferase, MiaB/RimO family protein n=1 Tax=Berkelbacteria bacterium GW2011_GWA2_38_9 TaxID=1618334 RepID=A0A0G0LRL2_9BACT|nr:MAG: radical SAM methylthiotransferase, MiaB/RimO family protein [Berkelbacteria bacterium GW2011_GWA2_38_9]
MHSYGYNVLVLGCQHNVYDGEKIAHVLDQLGHFSTSERDADLIIILSCSVRQKAIDRIHGKIGYWRKLKKPKKVIITACVLPKEKEIFKPVVDAIVPPTEIIDYLIKNYQIVTSNATRVTPTKIKDFIPKDCKHAYVPITIGCNNFCTYCAVPFTRGREASRLESEILLEIENLANTGISEITLLGQNVNSFGLSDWNPRDLRKNRDKTGRAWSGVNPSPFVILLDQIEKTGKIQKLSFLSPNPQDMSDDLLDWMAKSSIFSHELNLPVQSGDDEVLHRMNRRYSRQEYLDLVKKIKKAVPNIWLSTDVIVGFPGETIEQFENTVNLVKQVGFKKAFIGQYSPRPGTISAKLYVDDIPQKEKKRRWKVLDDLING